MLNLQLKNINLEKKNNKNTNNKNTRKKKSNYKRKKRSSAKSLSEQILQLFNNDHKARLGYKQILEKVTKGKKHTKEAIIKATNSLWEKGKLHKSKNDLFSFNKEADAANNTDKEKWLIEGVVDMTKSGGAYIISAQTEKDAFVSATKLNRALDGDRVQVSVYKKRGGKRLEGAVVKIIERQQNHFVGILKISKKFAFLIPDKMTMKVDLFIPKNRVGEAQNGDKVLVKIVEWPDGKKSPVAAVVAVLGKPGENDAEMQAILVDKGFSLHFPKEVMEEADQLTIEISEKEIKRRRDFRHIPTLTIDPKDAKDFDDALSIQQLPNGNWEVGIHIADVTHYAQPHSAMDTEAAKRCTSVYLVDRVLPMFPENLSNRVCSLRPHEDKLCFSAVFELNRKAEVQNRWFGRTVIHSNRRFNYTEAQKVLDTAKGDMMVELFNLNELAVQMRQKRFANGSINFGSSEVKFELDETGKPIDIVLKESKASNLLIEDFMLLANREVAAFINRRKIGGEFVPSVNRAHDSPDPDKLETFRKLAATFGHELILDDPKQIAHSINKVLKKIEGKPEEHLLSTLAIRTMAKATYATKNIGHYGLAFDHYTHFTSPIRRYPDVLVHRILAGCLSESNTIPIDGKWLEKQCEHASSMERKAMDAERESTKYKQVEYMSERLGEVYEGVISGVQPYGFFVELTANKCEGLVRIEKVEDDHYIYDEERYCFVGFHSKKKFQMGGKVMVQVVKTDLATRTIDFELASE